MIKTPFFDILNKKLLEHERFCTKFPNNEQANNIRIKNAIKSASFLAKQYENLKAKLNKVSDLYRVGGWGSNPEKMMAMSDALSDLFIQLYEIDQETKKFLEKE